MNRIEVRLPWGEDALAVDGERVPLAPSLELRNHSPTGFAWGYGGSGPSQTALAVLLHVTGDPEVAQNHYMQFKWDHVARWPSTRSGVHEVDVAAWLEADRLRAGMYRFRVEGVAQGHRSYVLAFEEEYEVGGEHVAEALEKLLREVEWGILDSDQEFSITYLPSGPRPPRA